jgi:predicted transcriptional regulator
MRRSRYEIIFDVLESIPSINKNRRKAILTNIMVVSRSNCNVVKDILSFLLEKKLIKIKIKKDNYIRKRLTTYQITEKGMEALKLWKELKTIVG